MTFSDSFTLFSLGVKGVEVGDGGGGAGWGWGVMVVGDDDDGGVE